MKGPWPTYDEAEALAKDASNKGWRLELVKRKNGFSWTWQHVPSNFTFAGSTTAREKPVALVCALMGVPIVSQ